MRRLTHRSGLARTSRRSLLTLFSALLATAALAACGNTTTQSPATTASQSTPAATPSASVPATQAPSSASPAPTPAGVDVDACAILPTALIPTILDGEPAFPTPVQSAGWTAGQCAWNGPNTSFILRVGTSDTIAAFGDPAAPDAAAMLAAFRQRAEETGPATELVGIGDGAVLGAAGMAAQLGDTYVEITRLRLTDEQLTG